MTEADVIVVGAGLAGLVATYELSRAGRRVLVLDQENRNNLGAQAFWSLGGLFLVDSPEQRRLGIKDSVELARAHWPRSPPRSLRPAGSARPASTGTATTTGPGSGPTRTSTSPRPRSGRTCTSWACASRRWSAGPSGAAGPPTATATRCPGST